MFSFSVWNISLYQQMGKREWQKKISSFEVLAYEWMNERVSEGKFNTIWRKERMTVKWIFIQIKRQNEVGTQAVQQSCENLHACSCWQKGLAGVGYVRRTHAVNQAFKKSDWRPPYMGLISMVAGRHKVRFVAPAGLWGHFDVVDDFYIYLFSFGSDR